MKITARIKNWLDGWTADKRERFAWLDAWGYLVVGCLFAATCVFKEYQLDAIALTGSAFCLYKWYENDVAKEARFQRMVEARRKRDAKERRS